MALLLVIRPLVIHPLIHPRPLITQNLKTNKPLSPEMLFTTSSKPKIQLTIHYLPEQASPNNKKSNHPFKSQLVKTTIIFNLLKWYGEPD